MWPNDDSFQAALEAVMPLWPSCAQTSLAFEEEKHGVTDSYLDQTSFVMAFSDVILP